MKTDVIVSRSCKTSRDEDADAIIEIENKHKQILWCSLDLNLSTESNGKFVCNTINENNQEIKDNHRGSNRLLTSHRYCISADRTKQKREYCLTSAADWILSSNDLSLPGWYLSTRDSQHENKALWRSCWLEILHVDDGLSCFICIGYWSSICLIFFKTEQEIKLSICNNKKDSLWNNWTQQQQQNEHEWTNERMFGWSIEWSCFASRHCYWILNEWELEEQRRIYSMLNDWNSLWVRFADDVDCLVKRTTSRITREEIVDDAHHRVDPSRISIETNELAVSCRIN